MGDGRNSRSFRSEAEQRISESKIKLAAVRKELWQYGATVDIKQVMLTVDEVYDHMIHTEIALTHADEHLRRETAKAKAGAFTMAAE